MNEENDSFCFLFDIDGTLSEDIKNEDSHKYADALPLLGAKENIERMISDGHVIGAYFTAREEKDRAVTQEWLDRHGFPNAPLIMGKPRIGDCSHYVWVDNVRVEGYHFTGKWNLNSIPEAE